MNTPMWIEYDKITDDLMYIGRATLIQCCTNLSRKENNSNERVSFHKEFGYLKNGEHLSSIKRSYNCHLLIKNFQSKAYVIIGMNDMILMRRRLDQVERWFQTSFGIKEEKLYITRQQKPVVVDALTENKWIEFLPAVITKEDGTQIQGVSMNLYNEVVVEITIDNFYGMKYLFETINLIDMANHMINYLRRPTFGTNYTDLSYNDTFENPMQQEPPNRKKGGFFSQ